MTTQSASLEQSRTTGADFIRNVLYGNATFSFISGTSLVLFSNRLGAWTGINATALLIVGIGVVLFGFDVAYMASRNPFNKRVGQAIMVADVSWVLASIVVLVGGFLPLTTAGVWTIAIIADMVAVFAILEYVGLRRLEKSQA